MEIENSNSYGRKNPRALKIRKAAYELITEVPFADITMTAIAERAGVAKGTIFNYFRNKEDIFMAISLTGYQYFCEEIEKQLAEIEIKDKVELKQFLLEQTQTLVQEYQIIILINSLRRFSLEAHADPIQTEEGRTRIFLLINNIVKEAVKNIPDVDLSEIRHAFIIQGAILNGMLNFGNLDQVNNIQFNLAMPDMVVNVVDESINLFSLYLDSILFKK